MKRIIGLLGWVGVVLVLAGLALRYLRPEDAEWSKWLAISGLVATLLYTLTQWRDIARSFEGRHVRYGSMALGSVVLLLAILVAINWISTQQSKRWDLTQAKQFSLSDQTKNILGTLKHPVDVKVFYGASTVLQDYRDRLEEYGHFSNQKFNVEYIDAERQPGQARAAGVQSYGTIVFEYDGRTERATTSDEQDITNALIKVVQGQARKVYFVSGHGERSATDTDQLGYSQVAQSLKNDNLDTATLALAQEGKIPSDASALIVPGPKTDFLPAEIDALNAYLKKGGKLVLMFDPPEKADAPPLTNLEAFAKSWGVDVGNNLVLDLANMSNQGPFWPIAVAYPSHPITSRFGKEMTIFRIAESVTPVEGGVNGHTAEPVVQTSSRSWAKTDLKKLLSGGKVDPTPAKEDKLGPLTLVAATSAAATDAAAGASPDAIKPETRVVITGDSDFADNDLLMQVGNRDFFMNMVDWVTQQENLISIRPRDPADRRVNLTEDQTRLVEWLVLIIIPGLLVATGVWTWWKRR